MEAVLTALPPQTIHHVGESSAIAAVRRAGSRSGARLRHSTKRVAGRVALVVTEAATNILKHAGSGDILLRGLAAGDARGVEVMAIDKGPGIANIAQAMRDGISTAGSSGIGLGAMQRLSDEFDLHADATHGSALRMAVWASRPGAGTAGMGCRRGLPSASQRGGMRRRLALRLQATASCC